MSPEKVIAATWVNAAGGGAGFAALPGPVAVAVRIGLAGGRTGGGGAGSNCADPIAAGIGAGGGGAGKCAPGAVGFAGFGATGTASSLGGGNAGVFCCGCGSAAICGDCRLDSIGPDSGGCFCFRVPFTAGPAAADCAAATPAPDAGAAGEGEPGALEATAALDGAGLPPGAPGFAGVGCAPPVPGGVAGGGAGGGGGVGCASSGCGSCKCSLV